MIELSQLLFFVALACVASAGGLLIVATWRK